MNFGQIYGQSFPNLGSFAEVNPNPFLNKTTNPKPSKTNNKSDGDFYQQLLNVMGEMSSPERYNQLLGIKSQFDSQQMARALPYNMLQQLPGQITQAFALPAATVLAGKMGLAQGIGQSADIMAKAGTNMASLTQLSPRGFSFNPTSYI
tara:strand:+ start:3154 stop:3600 length:447 start_codon:yes stop_codon:yes gene_type:complete